MARHFHGNLLLTVVSLAAATGCAYGTHYPKLRSPGPAKYQRANAEAFDPYPLPDMGPPIDGGRPREFGIPRNEVERAQDESIVQAARRNSLAVQAGVPLAGGSPVPMTMPGTTAPAFTPTTPSVPTMPSYTPSAPVYTPPAGVPSYPTIPTTPSYGTPTGQPDIRY